MAVKSSTMRTKLGNCHHFPDSDISPKSWPQQRMGKTGTRNLHAARRSSREEGLAPFSLVLTEEENERENSARFPERSVF